MMARDQYLEPYRQSAETHGADFGVTLWASMRSQQRRFEVFAELCDMTGRHVLDAGCSRGDFAEFLIDAGVGFESYVGVDGLPSVIEHAQRRGLSRCTFVAGDFLVDPGLLAVNQPQVVCISGSLNTMTDRQAATVLESAWDACGETLLFNFLADIAGPLAPPQLKPARRMDALRFIKWAARRTGKVTYRQDYLPHGHDGTIMMRR
ncbi:MAG: hypothetical protein CMJ18_25190 [Phycisphaeraceae bacterium]|nr:hypothetical protein [Phycisphaeraceae bacterium]